MLSIWTFVGLTYVSTDALSERTISMEGGLRWKKYCIVIFFFFSSRRRHTRCSRDWGSDVCSSDLALGCRVKSGWATAVLVEGPARSPRVIDRRAIDLSDAQVPTSRQPYHAVRDAPPGQAAKLERRLRGLVERVTQRSLGVLLKAYRRQGRPVRCVALVVGSLIDPPRSEERRVGKECRSRWV